MNDNQIMIITGASKGIGKYLAEYYSKKGFHVIGCSRKSIDHKLDNYHHFILDVSDESEVKNMISSIRKKHGKVDILINNAGIASMNHALLTDIRTVNKIYNTNFFGTFLFCREASKIMARKKFGRIINFVTVAVPLNLEGEAIYASSKSSVLSFTKILAKEVAENGITVNAIGPTPVKTDLIRSVPEEKIKNLIQMQAIKRFGEFSDISNIVDFYISPRSGFITGQVMYLGGV